MTPKLHTLIRLIMAACLFYMAAYMVLLYYHRIVGGVYTEDGLVVVATWGRTWDLSPVIVFALWGICGGYLLNKEE